MRLVVAAWAVSRTLPLYTDRAIISSPASWISGGILYPGPRHVLGICEGASQNPSRCTVPHIHMPRPSPSPMLPRLSRLVCIPLHLYVLFRSCITNIPRSTLISCASSSSSRCFALLTSAIAIGRPYAAWLRKRRTSSVTFKPCFCSTASLRLARAKILPSRVS